MNDTVIQWLLGDENAPVQYLTLTRLLGKSETDRDVLSAKERIMEYPVTQRILDRSTDFLNDSNYYRKYTGAYWQFIFLGWFRANGADPRITDIAEHILEHHDWIEDHGFHCLTANLLAAFMRLGYSDHPYVSEQIESLAQRVVRDQGAACGAMLYSLHTKCHMTIPKLLLCFAEVRTEKRSDAVTSAIEILRRILLENEVYIYQPSTKSDWQKVLETAPKKDELPKGETVKQWITDAKNSFIETHGYGTRTPKLGWLKFGFPLHYNSDILEAMYAFAVHNTPMSPQLEKPLEALRGKMLPDGTWKMENSLNGKMWADVEKKGKPSKWITFFALYVLNHFDA